MTAQPLQDQPANDKNDTLPMVPATIETSETMTENQEACETSAPQKNRVVFQGVSIRQFDRSLGDNPSAQGGPPLGLSWIYKDVTRDENGASNFSRNVDQQNILEVELPPTMIPIDDYEQQAACRRKEKLIEILKLQKITEKKNKANLRLEQRRASTGNIYFQDNDEALGIAKKKTSNDDDNTLTEDQMKQLSARWLKIQPVSGKTRERIILKETNCTKGEILARTEQMRKLQNQRKNTIAISETGMDEWQMAAEFIKRRYRRFKTGISKKKEQELLWEQAQGYWLKHSEKSLAVKRLTTSVTCSSQLTSSTSLSAGNLIGPPPRDRKSVV